MRRQEFISTERKRKPLKKKKQQNKSKIPDEEFKTLVIKIRGSELGERINKYRENFNKELEKYI